MTNQNWETQTAEEILDNIKKEIERWSKLRMHHTLKTETKHKGFKND
jgi:chromatin segregation and condensation protein Rec8/ScpA/Scc1 (kleisin family)